jgi:hypothetical protein
MTDDDRPPKRILTPEEAAKWRARATKVKRIRHSVSRTIRATLKPKPEPPKPF